MVHAQAPTGPAGVVLDETSPLEPFAAWAQAAKSGGGAVWMQINHPGRQVAADLSGVARGRPTSASPWGSTAAASATRAP
ncbi:hypothetical protein [Kitasatospora sp. NPDC088134]|uniref:hypothetical protein n=1 Tax=Kitasatospora sp. NPDC088134 TaxID=3364071 RepID=UPI00381F94AA